MRISVAALTAVFAVLALTAFAQNVVNPTQVQFTVSLDHALVTSYALGIFANATSLTPIGAEITLGKPTPDANGVALVSINTQPVTFADGMVARVRAIAGTVSGLWSDPSNLWDRKPGSPSKVIAKDPRP
jgi:hypothetical protein